MTYEEIEKQAIEAYEERKHGNVLSAQHIEHKLWYHVLRAIVMGNLECSSISAAQCASALTDYEEIY